MPNYAHCTLIGHLGRDPELRHLPDGSPVASFSLATSRKRKDGETTTWWRCTLFGKRAEVLVGYLHKGDPVLVSGEPYQREWVDKEGATRLSLELDVRDFAFVGGKAARSDPAPEQRASQKFQAPADFDDQLPF